MKKWIKFGLILLLLAAASVGIYLILRSCGITDVNQLRDLIASCGAWGWIVFIALFTLSTTLLCFVPGISMTFITVSIILFGAMKGFLISSIAIFIASTIMFWIGNTVGERAAVKLVGLLGPKWPSHSPAACRPRWRRWCPSCRHTRCPRSLGTGPPPGPDTCHLRSPASGPNPIRSLEGSTGNHFMFLFRSQA